MRPLWAKIAKQNSEQRQMQREKHGIEWKRTVREKGRMKWKDNKKEEGEREQYAQMIIRKWIQESANDHHHGNHFDLPAYLTIKPETLSRLYDTDRRRDIELIERRAPGSLMSTKWGRRQRKKLRWEQSVSKEAIRALAQTSHNNSNSTLLGLDDFRRTGMSDSTSQQHSSAPHNSLVNHSRTTSIDWPDSSAPNSIDIPRPPWSRLGLHSDDQGDPLNLLPPTPPWPEPSSYIPATKHDTSDKEADFLPKPSDVVVAILLARIYSKISGTEAFIRRGYARAHPSRHLDRSSLIRSRLHALSGLPASTISAMMKAKMPSFDQGRLYCSECSEKYLAEIMIEHIHGRNIERTEHYKLVRGVLQSSEPVDGKNMLELQLHYHLWNLRSPFTAFELLSDVAEHHDTSFHMLLEAVLDRCVTVATILRSGAYEVDYWPCESFRLVEADSLQNKNPMHQLLYDIVDFAFKTKEYAHNLKVSSLRRVLDYIFCFEGFAAFEKMVRRLVLAIPLAPPRLSRHGTYLHHGNFLGMNPFFSNIIAIADDRM